MKRVRKGYDELLHGQARAQEHAGRLRISQGTEPERLNSWVSLPVEACEALGITAALEDVPEPWERVRDAVLAAASVLVARARDAVVEAAKRQRASWESLPPPAPDYDDRVTATEEAVRLLLNAERAEAEARARLEALR